MADARIDATLRLSRIVFGALLASIGIYAVIATVVVSSKPATTPVPIPELSREPLSNPFFLALAAISLVMLAMTPFIRGKLMPARSRVSDGPRDVSRAIMKLRTAEIVSWAMCEAIAIYGLILTMLSYNTSFTYGFAAIAALAMLAYAPSRRVVEEVVRAATPDS